MSKVRLFKLYKLGIPIQKEYIELFEYLEYLFKGLEERTDKHYPFSVFLVDKYDVVYFEIMVDSLYILDAVITRTEDLGIFLPLEILTMIARQNNLDFDDIKTSTWFRGGSIRWNVFKNNNVVNYEHWKKL